MIEHLFHFLFPGLFLLFYFLFFTKTKLSKPFLFVFLFVLLFAFSPSLHALHMQTNNSDISHNCCLPLPTTTTIAVAVEQPAVFLSYDTKTFTYILQQLFISSITNKSPPEA
jgi:hypothetical protein